MTSNLVNAIIPDKFKTSALSETFTIASTYSNKSNDNEYIFRKHISHLNCLSNLGRKSGHAKLCSQSKNINTALTFITIKRT